MRQENENADNERIDATISLNSFIIRNLHLASNYKDHPSKLTQTRSLLGRVLIE